MKISSFYNNELVDYASYSTLRMIASAIDGLKNSHRKVISTIIDKPGERKVSQYAALISQEKEYLHGEVSLQGVLVNLAIDYTGSNNMNLLEPIGNFGTRFTPEPSAPRYIYTNKSKYFDYLFKKEDNPILIKQYFEGEEIEPKFYLPTLPLLLINGSEGMATGFAQKILPRDPEEIKKYIADYLKGSNKKYELKPYFRGFKGFIRNGDSKNQWEIIGKIERVSSTRIKITEVPVGYSLKGYLKVLDKLEEDNFISGYQDQSEDDNFLFIINFKRGVLDKLNDEKLLDKLKLIKKITENYTAIDENNRIRVFDSVKEILDYYIEVKLKYLQKRKDYIINDLSEQIKSDVSRYVFIQAIVEDRLIINKRKKEDIIKDLEGYDKIIKIDGSYDYLLNMNILSLTKERLEKLLNDIKDKKKRLDEVNKKSLGDIWLEDINN